MTVVNLLFLICIFLSTILAVIVLLHVLLFESVIYFEIQQIDSLQYKIAFF